jgi:hypothetical protein
MAGVSVVLERDIPNVIVRRENEVSREVRKVDLKNLRWPKPPESAQDLKREKMVLGKKEVLLKNVLNLP